MANYAKEIEFVNNHLGQIATVILQNADFDKATPIDIYNIKHTLFTRKFFPSDDCDLQIDQVYQYVYSAKIFVGDNLIQELYIFPELKYETGYGDIKLSCSLSKTLIIKYKATFEQKYSNKLSLFDGKNDKLEINKKARQQYDEAVAAYEKVKADLKQYMQDISRLLCVPREKIDLYLKNAAEVLKDFTLDKDTTTTYLNKHCRFYSKDYIPQFNQYYQYKFLNDLREIKFDVNTTDYSFYFEKIKRKALINVSIDYIARTHEFMKDKVLKDLDIDEICKTISLNDAINQISAGDIFIKFVVKNYNDKDVLEKAYSRIDRCIYKYEDLKARLTYLYRIAYAVINIKNISVSDLKLILPYIADHNITIPNDLITDIQADHEKYDVFMDYLKSVGQRKIIAKNANLDVRSKYYYKTEVFAKRISREHGKTIYAFKKCDADVLEKLQSVQTDFNAQSKKAEMKNIKYGNPGISFIFEFLALEDPSEWDGRALGLITKLANDEFKSSGGAEIIRFSYDPIQLTEELKDEFDIDETSDDE